MNSNKKIKDMESRKGITLIALVITIIILLVLAGITISQLTGSSLLERSKEAGEKTELAQYYEEINLEISNAYMDYATDNKDFLRNLVQKLENKDWVNSVFVEDLGNDKFEVVVDAPNAYEIVVDVDNKSARATIDNSSSGKFEYNATITYDANDGNGTMEKQSARKGKKLKLKNSTFSKNGYVCVGWSLTSNGTQIENNIIQNVTGDITVYAIWKESYTISFDSNGGTGTMDPIQVVKGTDKELVENQFTKTDLYFSGWNTQANGSGTSYSDKATISNINSNITLYAQWAEDMVITGDSLIKAVADNNLLNNGHYLVEINGVSYKLHTYSIGTTTLSDTDTTDEQVTEIIYGDSTDVATSASGDTQYAKRMVVLKVNGDLTIGENVKLTTYADINGYGGPKGFLIYCTGTLTNNGEISMTARGARAVGQNVYLWNNANPAEGQEQYEVVPAAGASGGGQYHSHDGGSRGSNAGSSGKNRKTGGGGSGYAYTSSGEGRDSWSGAGSTGTSYSGGSGGGGAFDDRYDYFYYAGAGAGNGGAGGYAAADGSKGAGGGAGNPGGNSASGGATNNITTTKGENGTGGLLIIYSNNIINNKTISAEGKKGAVYGGAEGGSSGGGSINLFYSTNYTVGENAEITANGGQRESTGGSGGNGSIAIGNISTGTYVDTYHNWTN